MAYLSGVNYYKTHEEAQRHWFEITRWSVLNEMPDGTATITFLQANPVDPGQPEFIGVGIEQNKPR